MIEPAWQRMAALAEPPGFFYGEASVAGLIEFATTLSDPGLGDLTVPDFTQAILKEGIPI